MHHYKVIIIDSKSCKEISFNVYGKLSVMEINGSSKSVIVNEYNTPLYIETINTIDIIKER